jgi:prepilin-type N-terminal cleavage/methylation domain-containing protein
MKGGEEMKMKKKLLKGFTMIELLIVIAVLGILAVAVLSAINPIEQINRSRDTGSRSAIDRFYASNGYYPWRTSADDTEVDGSTPTGWEEVSGTLWTDGADAVLTKLSAVGTAEVKESFVTRITGTSYNSLFVYNLGTQGASTYVCFAPRSANFVTEAGIRCDAVLPTDYPASACGNVTDCGTTGDCICLP